MKKLFLKMIKSRKFLMAVFGSWVIPWVAEKIGLPPEQVQTVLYSILAYILGQAGVDAANYFRKADPEK